MSDKTYGDPSFTITATASSGLPVTFTTSSGACSVTGITVTLLAAGSCAITTHQAGDTNYNPAPDVTRTFTISKADTTVTIVSSPNPSILDQMVTFTVTVTSGAGTSTGNVVLKEGAATLSTSSLGDGVANFTVSTFTDGLHSIMAIYNGNDNFDTNVSTPLTQTVKAHFKVYLPAILRNSR